MMSFNLRLWVERNDSTGAMLRTGAVQLAQIFMAYLRKFSVSDSLYVQQHFNSRRHARLAAFTKVELHAMLLVLAVHVARAAWALDGQLACVARQFFYSSLVAGLYLLINSVGEKIAISTADRQESRMCGWLDLVLGLHLAEVMLMLAFTPAPYRFLLNGLRIALSAMGLQFWPMAAWNLCFAILTQGLLAERPLDGLWSEVAVSAVSVCVACVANYFQETEGYEMLAASWVRTLNETSDFVFTLDSDLRIVNEVPQLSKMLTHDVFDMSLQGMPIGELMAAGKDRVELTDFLMGPRDQTVRATRLNMRSQFGTVFPMMLFTVRMAHIDGTERHICGLCDAQKAAVAAPKAAEIEVSEPKAEEIKDAEVEVPEPEAAQQEVAKASPPSCEKETQTIDLGYDFSGELYEQKFRKMLVTRRMPKDVQKLLSRHKRRCKLDWKGTPGTVVRMTFH